jgi:hypothetical protein
MQQLLQQEMKKSEKLYAKQAYEDLKYHLRQVLSYQQI